MTEFGIEKLDARHAVEEFDCGQGALNRFLIRFALVNQRSHAAQTYIGLANDTIIGYYTLAVGEIAYADAAHCLVKGMARHPVPVMLLARLAVHRDGQGQGIGAGLLKDAIRRTAQAADIAGIRALVVHAKDDAARGFYERFGFAPSPTDPWHLFILIKELA